MSRRRKFLANTVTSLMYQIVTVVSGFILPRFFISFYGSAINGLATSITQFLGFITFCELGVGAVIQSSLYKPLAEKNTEEVSRIVTSSEKFFRRIACILLAYIVCLCIVYPRLNNIAFDALYTIGLILIISISSFAQYFFGATYRLLLNADQMGFVQFGMRSIAIIINVFLSVLLMRLGYGIHIVKLCSSVIFLLQPLALSVFCKKHYRITKIRIYRDEPIKQKWNGVAQHVAYVVLQNTDVAVLTLFSTLENVSVYGVYLLAVNGLRLVVESLSGGIESAFGNMIAKKEQKTLNDSFKLFEWMLHTGVSIVFSILAILIVPFVSIYTKGVNDANYQVPIFGVLLVSAYAFYCLQIPYNLLVHAAGHYKETQVSSIIEATINIVVSIIAVRKYQLVGVAIGTLAAMCFRSVYLSVYISKHIIARKILIYFKHLIIDFWIVLSIVLINKVIVMPVDSYAQIVLLAIVLGTISLMVAALINYIFNHKQVMIALNMIARKRDTK